MRHTEEGDWIDGWVTDGIPGHEGEITNDRYIRYCLFLGGIGPFDNDFGDAYGLQTYLRDNDSLNNPGRWAAVVEVMS